MRRALAILFVIALGVGFVTWSSGTARASVSAVADGTQAASVVHASGRRSHDEPLPQTSSRLALAPRLVRVVAFGSERSLPNATLTVRAPARSPRVAEETDAGVFALVAADDEVVTIAAPGFVARHASATELVDGAAIALRPLANRPIDVPVFDTRGAPIAGALVRVESPQGGRAIEARTDATGLARFVLAGGTRSIFFEGSVSARGYTDAAFSALDTGRDEILVTTELRADRAAAVVLHGNAELRALVVDALGAPRRDALLTVRPAGGRHASTCDGGSRSPRAWAARTDAFGDVVLDTLPTGVALEWSVEGDPAGEVGTFTLAPGASTLTLVPSDA